MKLIYRFEYFIKNPLFFSAFICLLIISLFVISSLNVSAQSLDTEVIFFDSDVNTISQESIAVINSKVNALVNKSEYTITLEGYSDITGKADYNLELSNNRARLVKDYLVDLGIDPDKIKVVGKGGTEKYGKGETNDALRQNRRVNLIIDIAAEPPLEIENLENEDISQAQIPETTQEPLEGTTSKEPAFQQIESAGQSTSEKLSKKIEKKVREHASGGIVFNTPAAMQVGETYLVEAEISYSLIEALSKDLADISLDTKIGVNLSGNGFAIYTESENDLYIPNKFQKESDIKTIEKDYPSKWEWHVTPLTDGMKSLILSVAIIAESSKGEAINDDYPTFQRVIDVKPNMIHSITGSYWVMGILILLIIVIVAWILIRKVKLN